MSKKIKLLYDIKTLLTADAFSGIPNVAYRVLEEMHRRPELDITLYNSSFYYHDYKEVKYAELFEDQKTLTLQKKTKSAIYKLERLINQNKLLNRHRIIRLPFTAALISLKKLCKRTLSRRDFPQLEVYYAFFTPGIEIPEELHNAHKIKKYAMIHDLSPLSFYKKFQVELPVAEDFKKILSLSQKPETLTKSYHFFAISEFSKQEALKYLHIPDPDSITVTYLGVSEDFAPLPQPLLPQKEQRADQIKEKYKIPKDKRYFLCLGNRDPRKNLFFTMKNFFKFIEQHNITDLVIVIAGGTWGKENAFEDYEEFIKDFSSHKDKIIITGFVDKEDLPLLYNFAESLVYPSLLEGFGLPVIEAMKCGCPVITSNVTSLPEVASDAAITIDPTSDEELLLAYEKIIFDNAFKKNMIQKGLERSKKFTWKICVDLMLEKIRQAN